MSASDTQYSSFTTTVENGSVWREPKSHVMTFDRGSGSVIKHHSTNQARHRPLGTDRTRPRHAYDTLTNKWYTETIKSISGNDWAPATLSHADTHKLLTDAGVLNPASDTSPQSTMNVSSGLGGISSDSLFVPPFYTTPAQGGLSGVPAGYQFGNLVITDDQLTIKPEDPVPETQGDRESLGNDEPTPSDAHPP